MTACAMSDLVHSIDEWIHDRRRGVICCANVHVVETARHDSALASALADADIVVPDGAPVAWFASRKAGRPVRRITGSDVFEAVALRDAGKRRHLLFGSTRATLERLENAMRAENPTIEIVGAISPPFRQPTPADVRNAASEINAASPDVVWVGLGAPKQELWMHTVRPLVDAPVLVGVGAVFDIYSGVRRRAPRWAQRVGLEWTFRLAQEPRRLGPRYALTNASFVAGVAGEVIGVGR